MANCGVCAAVIEGREARKCPTKKCNNPICLICDPLETTSSKAIGVFKTLGNLVTGDLGEIIHDDLSKRVRCNSCSGRDKKHDRWIIATVVALFAWIYSADWFSEASEYLFNTDIGGIAIFIVIFIPVLILTHKLLLKIYFPSR